jgi:hypothetical protein
MADITFIDRADHKIYGFIEKLKQKYDLNPETNEDYKQFLISEGVYKEGEKPICKTRALN